MAGSRKPGETWKGHVSVAVKTGYNKRTYDAITFRVKLDGSDGVSREAIKAAANYLSTAVYTMYRRLYQANPDNNPDFFSVPAHYFQAGLADADMKCSETELTDALAALAKDKAPMPELTHDALAQNYPVLYQSLLQVVHNTGERVNGIMAGRKDK